MRRLLLPVAWLIYGCSQLFKKRPKQAFSVPVIVVGNISVGGTGKTPFVCALVEELKKRGYTPGVVSRGYKGKCSSTKPYVVLESDSAHNTGDEPMLIALKAEVPVVICKKRPKAVEALLEQFPAVNIIISDDGLQHTALHRDIEIVLFKEDQSPLLFPAGKLREPLSRLKTVDFVVKDQFSRSLSSCIYLLNQSNIIRALSSFRGNTIYAVAGTAYPQGFFEDLKKQGIEVIECPCPDHYQYKSSDFMRILEYTKKAPVFITEKDAVKLKEWKEGTNPNIWVVPMLTKIAPLLLEEIIKKLDQIAYCGSGVSEARGI